MSDPHDRPYTFGWHGEVIRAAIPERAAAPEFEYVIDSGWLCESVNRHTCGTGPSGHYGAHEPGCGLIPVADIADLLAEHDRAIAERAWDECLQAISWAIEHGPWEHAIPHVAKNNPHRKDADQ